MADLVQINHRRQRHFRRVDGQFADMTDEELRRRFRFSQRSIDRLVGLVGHRLQRQTMRNSALTPTQQILVALRFYASGSFLQVIGDTFGFDTATVSRVLRDVTDVLFDLKDRAIGFPVRETELNKIKQGFFNKYHFPGVIGCIDGTHVRILSPGQPNEGQYVNRKHQHTINVQASCDHKGMFTSINACWPGSSHDSHVFRTSRVCQHLEANHQDPEKGFLLGDSGYPCRPFLLTPYLHPESAKEEHYNACHMSTRNLIERVFGMWKRKFNILHGEIRMKPEKASKIIVVCAILYNLSIIWNEPLEEEEEDIDQPQHEQFNGPMDGRGFRDHITNTFFQ